jgi:serine/threonine protein kinase
MASGEQQLGSLYVLEYQIGVGGMGTVWRGRTRTTGQPIAIKLLHDQLATDPGVVTRFVQERTVLVGLRHPNLVAVHDMIMEGGRLALIMDLVEGEDLHRHRHARGTLAPALAAVLIGQVCEALAVVHAAGVVHRDLKPANVLLDASRPTPVARLTDFGIARIADAAPLTVDAAILGTPAYLAPEVVSGQPGGPASDVYAAGTTLYELLVGRSPFAGGPAITVARRHLDAVPRRLATIPEPLWAVMAACLEKDPARRPDATTVASLLYGVVPALRGLPAAPALPADADASATSEPLPAALHPDEEPYEAPVYDAPGTFYRGVPTPPPPVRVSPAEAVTVIGPRTPPPAYQPTPTPPVPTLPDAPATEHRSRGRVVALSALTAAAVIGVGVGAAVFALPGSQSSAHAANGTSTTTGADAPGAGPGSASSSKTSATPSAKQSPKTSASHGATATTAGGGASQTSNSTAPGGGAPGNTGASGPAPIGSWSLAGSAADVTGAHPGTASNVSWGSGHGGCGVFNGSSSAITTSGPVLNTAAGSGFTVSAWVYLTKGGNYATAVSQDSTIDSGFYLQYSGADNRWSFARVKSNATNIAGIRALSSAAPALNTWTHLVGVYDGSSGQLRLYVNGALEGRNTDTTPFAADGALVIGRAQFNGKAADWFPGDISDVEAFDQALTSGEIQAL